MRYCAGLQWEQSTARLQRRPSVPAHIAFQQRRLPRTLLLQWQEATRAVCAHAYAPFQQGTIYPQLVVGCDDQLNRALLRQFLPINNQGDLERGP